MNEPAPPFRSRAVGLAGICLWLVAGIFLFAHTVDRDLNHDEHQFIVPGALLAGEGALPYRDYPLFHLPNLVFAYAALDRLIGDPILAPKLLSFAGSWLAVGAILWAAFRTIRAPTAHLIVIGASLLVLFLFDPLVLYTAGKTWNHEVPACLLILSILFHVESARCNSLPLIALSGAACGLAVGCRLTFAPCLLPLVALTLFFPGEMRRRWRMAALFTGAATLALAPSLYFLATSPQPFVFGNLEFPRLRLLDPDNSRIRKTMTPWRKMRYFIKEIVRPSWPVFLVLVTALVATFRSSSRSRHPGLRVIGWTALALLFGCFLPSRYQYQHYFAVIPVALLAIAFAWRRDGDSAAGRRLVMLVAAAAAGSVGLAIHASRESGASILPAASRLIHRDTWFSSRAAAFGQEIRAQVPAGRVLTLAPAWPVAGKIAVYPEFATGPFAWRSARFVASERRAGLHLVAPDDLEAFLAAKPPAAILTGVEDDELEKPLIAYAQAHGFREVPLGRRRELWLAPAR